MTIQQLNQDAESIIEATRFTSPAELKAAWVKLTKQFAKEELEKVKEAAKTSVSLEKSELDNYLTVAQTMARTIEQAINNLK